MSKKIKASFSRLLCVALAASMLAGCSGTSGGSEEKNSAKDSGGNTSRMGRYIEETMSEPGTDRVLGAFRDKDGSLVYYGGDGDGVQRFSYTPGGEKRSEEIEVLKTLEADGNIISDVSEGSDGTLYILCHDSEMKSRLVRSSDGSTYEEIDMPDWNNETNGMIAVGPAGSRTSTGPVTNNPENATSTSTTDVEDEENPPSPSTANNPQGGTQQPPQGGMQQTISGGGGARPSVSSTFFGGMGNYPSGVITLDDGFLVYYAYNGVKQYSTDGSLVREYPGTGTKNATVIYDGILASADIESQKIMLYDIESGELSDTFEYDGFSESTTVGLDAAGLFVADSTGIYRWKDSDWTMDVDGALTSLIMPDNIISALLSGDGGDYYAFIGDPDTQLVRYKYDPDVPSEPDTTLEVFSLYGNNTVRQAIGEFQRVNPNVRVNLRVAMDENAGATIEDVIRALNTELIGGKGPDIIVLDGLPIESYIEKGVLKDISELVVKLTDEQGLMENLTSAYSQDGKTYGIPSRFRLPVMMGYSDVLSSVNNLKDLVDIVEARQGEDIPLLHTSTSLWEDDGVIMDYYDSCADSFTNPDGTLDEAALAEFLANMLRLDETLKEHTAQSDSGRFMMAAARLGGGGTEEIDIGIMDMGNDAALMHVSTLSGMISLRMISSQLGNKEGMELTSLFGENKYTPQGGVGIVASGMQQELAESFVEMLLSGTVQDKYLYDGFPVNGNSLDKLVTEILEVMEENVNEKLSDMGFTELCSKLDTPVFVDQVVKDAVQSQAAALVEGAITPEEAAAKIVESTKLYLAE